MFYLYYEVSTLYVLHTNDINVAELFNAELKLLVIDAESRI